MSIRQEIIKKLDKTFFTHDNRYQMLKECLIIKPGTERTNGGIVDDWFKGVIESLYYRPNKYCLVLVGAPNIGKDYFFRYLLDTRFDWHNTDIYDNLIVQMEFTRNMLKLPEKDGYKIMYQQYESGRIKPFGEKRLASYCCTTNVWRHKPRKNFIVLHLESINQELFNSIDKELLWIEIFNKFKPEGK